MLKGTARGRARVHSHQQCWDPSLSPLPESQRTGSHSGLRSESFLPFLDPPRVPPSDDRKRTRPHRFCRFGSSSGWYPKLGSLLLFQGCSSKLHGVTRCRAPGAPIQTSNYPHHCLSRDYQDQHDQKHQNPLSVPHLHPCSFKFLEPSSDETSFSQVITIRCLVFRFPSLLPVLEPEHVAKMLIEGFRRNYKKVFIPSSLGLLGKLLT